MGSTPIFEHLPTLLGKLQRSTTMRATGCQGAFFRCLGRDWWSVGRPHGGLGRWPWDCSGRAWTALGRNRTPWDSLGLFGTLWTLWSSSGVGMLAEAALWDWHRLSRTSSPLGSIPLDRVRQPASWAGRRRRRQCVRKAASPVGESLLNGRSADLRLSGVGPERPARTVFSAKRGATCTRGEARMGSLGCAPPPALISRP